MEEYDFSDLVGPAKGIDFELDALDNKFLTTQPRGWAMTKKSHDFEITIPNSTHGSLFGTIKRPPGTLVQFPTHWMQDYLDFGNDGVEVWASPIEYACLTFREDLVLVRISIEPFSPDFVTYSVDSRKSVGRRWQQLHRSGFHLEVPSCSMKKRFSRIMRYGTSYR